MHQIKIVFILFLLGFIPYVKAQEPEDYIEFNDRKNTVHGVYLGLSTYYGKIKKKDTYSASLKIAYVANQQFEIGFEGITLYSDFNNQGLSDSNNDLVALYGGLHLEPILFSKSKLNLSFPLLVGGGAAAILEDHTNDYIIDHEDWEAVFVLEPGVNLLFNLNRYVQLEAGVKHRFSSRLSFNNSPISRINGFSVGLGVKVGVFNMGRNRYKKKNHV
ncbi:hypothetical protein [Aestuariivivens insulae]|uniref:hypothetical protein n=1 Tax=Aestuariivivens insulae TaxID=1621988 RepID=UPI001F58C8CD|nr:hypothetical protein [Aestuariivivens insulae]